MMATMEQVLTLVCKLNPTPKQVAQIEAILKAFADACNYANVNVKPQITSKISIQNAVYQDLRSLFGLSANLALRACARVGANRKTAKQKNKPVKFFKPTSADYDARIFAFREKDWTVSLTLSLCREHIRLDVGNYQRGKLKGKKPTSAIVAIENLIGIRERTNQQPRNKVERRLSNSWSFYQLRSFLEYKGLKEGVEVIAVPPAYTSQTCHQCLHIGLRSDKRFKCGNCGWHGDADLNGAKMISLLGQSVSLPGGSGYLCCNRAHG